MKEEQKIKNTNKYGVTAATKRTKNTRQKKFIWLAIRRYVQEYKIQINTDKTLFVLYCFAGKHTHIQHTYICM